MKRVTIPLLLVACFTFCSCKFFQGETDTETDVQRGSFKDSDSLHIKPVFYLDNSGSMKAYLSNPTKVLDILSGISSIYGEENVSAYYIQSLKKVECTFHSLRDQISHNNFQVYDATILEDLFKMIKSDYELNRTTSHPIYLLLTDGVPSGTNQEIRANPRFNMVQASTLQTRITDALASLPGMAASIYRFDVDYNGNYYFFDNTKADKHWTSHPIYIVAIGDEQAIADLAEKESVGQEYFKPTDKVHFNKVNSDAIKMSSSAFEVGTRNVMDDLFNDDDRINITLQLSLDGLPEYMKSIDYLRNSSDILLNGTPIEWDFCQAEEKMLNINVSVEQYKDYSLNFKMFNHSPVWINDVTIQNDKTALPSELDSKTFNFKYLVNGIKNAVLGNGGDTVLFQKRYSFSTDN